MITTCIYALRDVMRTVPQEYKTTDYGIKHKKHDTSAEIARLAAKLQEHALQSYVKDRKLAFKPVPIVDLMHQGSENLDNPKLYQSHIKSTRVIKNLGIRTPSTNTVTAHTRMRSLSIHSLSLQDSSQDLPLHISIHPAADATRMDSDGEESASDDDADGGSMYGPSREDLELDEEEPFGMMDEIVQKIAEAAGEEEVGTEEINEDEDLDAMEEYDQGAAGSLPERVDGPAVDSVGSPLGPEAGEDEMNEFFDSFFD